MRSEFCWLDIPPHILEYIHDFLPRRPHCICSHRQHGLLVGDIAYFLCQFIAVALFDQAIHVLWRRHSDMVRHENLLSRFGLISSLELLTFIDVEPIIPVDRFSSHEADVSLPSDHCIAVLDNICSLLC